MRFCHLKPNQFQLLLHDYITKNNKHLYLLSTSLSFYFADIKVFIVIFIKKFAKDAYYNLLMLGIQSPVGILKIHPIHTRAYPHTHLYTPVITHTPAYTPMFTHRCLPMHTRAHSNTPTQPRTLATPAHTCTHLATPSHTCAHLGIPKHSCTHSRMTFVTGVTC